MPWIFRTTLFLAFGAFMMVRGSSISTRVVGLFFAFEIVIMFIVVVALIKYHSYVTLKPFAPSHLTNGIRGLAAGFPLAVYLFIGWENSAALAEETENPRKNVPKAVFTSIALVGLSYLFFAFSIIVGFKNNVRDLNGATVPFLSVAHSVIGWVAFFAFLVGMTSTVGALIMGTNSQARLIFNAGREGLLPKFIGKVHDTRRTLVNALCSSGRCRSSSSASGDCSTFWVVTPTPARRTPRTSSSNPRRSAPAWCGWSTP